MIGTTISHYKIVESLGSGGMGVVYGAEDLTLGRRVALKFLPDTLAGNTEALARFRREARAASALNHPHICTIYELAEDEGRPFIVMELLDGQTLESSIGENPSPTAKIVRLGVQVANALAAAHQARVVHRDIKPANLFVTRRGDAKVLDFGLAKVTRELERPVSKSTRAETALAPEQLTTPGTTMGTMAYMSPEQVRGEELDARTDLFSLGVVLYEMATGRQPFAGKTAGATFDRILNQAATAPARLNPDLPEGLARVLDKALQKDKAFRYQSASDLEADLKRLELDINTETVSTGVESARSPSRPGRSLWLAIAAAATLVLALAAVMWLTRGSEPPIRPVADSTRAATKGAYASIAILPFVDLSPMKDQGYFTEGLSEELLNVLGQIRDLKVAGRTSSFQFKDQPEDQIEIFTAIGEKLGVASILWGSVRKAGDQVRISTRLISADGFILWSDKYDRTLEDIFAVQDDIAASVAAALEVTLLGGPADGGGSGDTGPEAYNLFLQALHFGRLTSRDGLEKAVEYSDRALVLDPTFAPAWAGLARARIWQAYQAYVPFDDGFRMAREAALEAVELDPGNAEGWAALGDIKRDYDRDWLGAELALGKARALAPSNTSVLLSAANLSGALGRSDQATAFARRAVEVDPLNTTAQYRLGITLMRAGHATEAEAAFHKVLELQPERDGTHLRLGIVELMRGNPEAALAAMERETAPHWRVYGLALASAALGRREAADAALAEMRETYGDDAAFQLSEIHAFREERDEAFEWLERAFEHHDPGLTDTRASPLLTNLHDDPRWPVFLRKMGLPG